MLFVPNKIWCDFLNTFSKYKIFIIVDNNEFDLSDFKNTYKNIKFIQIENKTCELHGYIDTNFILNKLISGWDKALYYFGVEEKCDYVWFLEDDVFLNHEDNLLKIDEQYKSSDFLSNTFCEKNDSNKWHWHRIKIQYSLPYYHGMMCAVRFSNRMITCINEYAKNHKTLCFLEALFPTIATKNNLQYNNPDELKNITYRAVFKKENIDKNKLYHPVKDINNHIF